MIFVLLSVVLFEIGLTYTLQLHKLLRVLLCKDQKQNVCLFEFFDITRIWCIIMHYMLPYFFVMYCVHNMFNYSTVLKFKR